MVNKQQAKSKLEATLRKAHERHWGLKITAALMFFVVYPAMIVSASHYWEGRTLHRATEALESNRHHSDSVSCLSYNTVAFATNKFHKAVLDFMVVARRTREKEIMALRKGLQTPRTDKLIEVDQEAVSLYNTIIKGILFSKYNPHCKIPKRAVRKFP
jgi:hypothetical protein